MSIYNYISSFKEGYLLRVPALLNASNCYIFTLIVSGNSLLYVFGSFSHHVPSNKWNRCPQAYLLLTCKDRYYSILIKKDRCSWDIRLVILNVALVLKGLNSYLCTKENFAMRILYNFIEIGLLPWEATSTD